MKARDPRESPTPWALEAETQLKRRLTGVSIATHHKGTAKRVGRRVEYFCLVRADGLFGTRWPSVRTRLRAPFNVTPISSQVRLPTLWVCGAGRAVPCVRCVCGCLRQGTFCPRASISRGVASILEEAQVSQDDGEPMTSLLSGPSYSLPCPKLWGVL